MSSLLCGFCLVPAAAADFPLAGDYDRVIVGEDSGVISGAFHDCTGECKFECAFSFTGKRAGDNFAIQAYERGSAAAIPGTLVADGKNLTIRLETLPGGCWNVEPGLDKAGAKVLLNAARPWLQIAILKRASALYDVRGKKMTEKLEKLEPVAILQRKPGWVFVEKPSLHGPRGWLRVSTLYP